MRQPGTVHIASRWWAAVLCLVVLTTSPAFAQDPADASADPDAAQSPVVDPRPGGWHGVFGRPAPDRLYLGAWVLHLKRPSDGMSEHWLVGLGWQGVFASTFTNSHGRRSWAIGLAREVFSTDPGPTEFSLEYRAGVIRGYDRRLMRLAGDWPVVPAAELIATLQRGRIGMTFGYAGIVTSVGLFVALGERDGR